MITLSFDGRI